MSNSKKIFLLFIISLNFFISNSLSQVQVRGAEYRTKNSYLYGRFEARIKAPGKEGILTSLFTYFDGLPNDPWSSSKWNEVDIEILGRYNNDIQFNTITPGQINHVRHQYVNFNPALDYHIYAFEWTPDYVAWFIDEVEVYRQTDDHIKTLTRAQKFMMNIWSPTYTNWAGVWNESVLPAFGFYDWAAYYKYTPGIGNYGSNNNFTFNWKDDFTFFDNSRWEKASHGFGGNRSDFVPENVVFANGDLILCLTEKTQLGFTDTKAPALISVRAVNENKLRVFYSEQVEKVSAETLGNYILTGSVISKASLLNDKRTVDLTVDKINFDSPPALIVRNVKDNLFQSNAINLLGKSLILTPQFKFPLKINIGGGNFLDFISDREFVTDTSNYGYMQGSISTNNNQIKNTNVEKIFQSEVYDITKYIVRIPNGKYRIKLMFAENYYTASSKRVFDVYVQGNKVLNALDIFKEVGSRSAFEKTIDNIEVNDYILDIHFAAIIGQPLINGIVIELLNSTNLGDIRQLPNGFVLNQNYPNPFNPSTTISWNLSQSSNVKLVLYDMLGRKIATLIDEAQPAGQHSIVVNADGIYNESINGSRKNSDYGLSTNNVYASGVYLYSLFAQGSQQTKKMILLR